jgi:glycosyltransferase involved in cell wall biosynthesis
MRLALLSPLPPEQNGLADYAAHLRASLNQAGVEVLTPLAGQRPVETLAMARTWVAERDWRGVDVVHAELCGGRHSEFLILCALAALPNRPALSATVHDPDRLIWKPVSRLWAFVNGLASLPPPAKHAVALLSDPSTLVAERRLARQLDGLVTFTQTGGGRLVKRMKTPVDNVSVIPHGVVTLAQRPLPPLDVIKLLYFGFIQRGKGIEDLIDALGRVKTQNPDMAALLLVTIAGGMAPDGGLTSRTTYLEQLRQRAERRDVLGLIQWELDVDERDVPDLVGRHHLLVLPHHDPRPLNLIGQMRGTSRVLAWCIACGRGAIASDAQAFAEEVSHGNGAAFRQGDVGALTALILGVLEEPEVLRKWASRAATLAQERAWPMTGQRFVGHFQRAISRAPRGRGGAMAGGPASVWSPEEPA